MQFVISVKAENLTELLYQLRLACNQMHNDPLKFARLEVQPNKVQVTDDTAIWRAD